MVGKTFGGLTDVAHLADRGLQGIEARCTQGTVAELVVEIAPTAQRAPPATLAAAPGFCLGPVTAIKAPADADTIDAVRPAPERTAAPMVPRWRNVAP